MSAEKIIRMQARQKLRNNGFAKALFGFAVIMLFFMLFQTVFSFVVIIAEELLSVTAFESMYVYIELAVIVLGVIMLWLICPVFLGYLKMMYSDNDDYELSDVLYFFENFYKYKKALKFTFSFIIRMILPFILFYLPATFLSLLTSFVDGFADSTVYRITNNSLIICSTIALLIYMQQYFLSFRIFCDNQDHKCSYYFYTSKILMRNNIKRVTKLLFSFTPWLLLCVTILPVLYVFPYITQALCISGNHISKLSRDGQGNEIF